MKSNDQKRALFDAVTGIDEDLIAEAAEPRVRPFQKRVLRLTAIAAALAILLTALSFWPAGEENYVTGPGILVVRAHEADIQDGESFESEILEEGVRFTSSVCYDPTKSYRQHFPFSFEMDESLYPGMELTMEIHTNAGIFYKKNPYIPNTPIWQPLTPDIVAIFMRYYGQNFTVGIDTPVYWEPNGFDYAVMEQAIKDGNHDFESAYKDFDFEESPSFIDVIIRADEYIVGYCVIAIYEIDIDDHPDRRFSFELVSMMSFPQVDGRYQDVSERYVMEQFQKLHETAENEMSK